MRKVKRLRDKVGPGVQMSIRKFLLKADNIISEENVAAPEICKEVLGPGTFSSGIQNEKPSKH